MQTGQHQSCLFSFRLLSKVVKRTELNMDNLNQYTDETLIKMYVCWLKQEMNTWDRRNIIISLKSSAIMAGHDLPVPQHINTQ